MAKYLKAGELKKIKNAVNALKRRVVAVVQSGEIAQIRTEFSRPKVPLMKRRPRLTSFFVGRDKELDQIKSILDEYGSVAVMQYGGIGKTQLATAFADRAESSGWVPGGCYWIRMGGRRSDAVESVAEFTESLTGRPIGEKDRVELRAAVSELWSVKLSNAEVEERMKRLATSNPAEYKALCDLASDNEECGMAGRPLALVQAGSFMNKNKISLAEYTELYRTMRNSPDLQRLLLKVEETGLQNPRQ